MRTAILISLAASFGFTGDISARMTGPAERAAIFYNHTEYAKAVAELNQSPATADNLELLGQCYFMSGEFNKATDALEKAAALAPADSMIQTWLGRAWGRRAETSFAFTAMGYATKTRQAFEKALQLDPGNAEALGDLFDFYVEAPGIIGGGMDKAAGLFPQFAKYDPVGLLLAQARIDEKKKQYAGEEDNLRRAIKAAPDKPGLVVRLAQFLSRRGRYDESEAAFRQAADLAPDSPRILFARADSYIQARRNLNEARDLLRKYLAASNLTPDDPPRREAVNLLKKAEGS